MMLEIAKKYLSKNVSIIPIGRDKLPLIKWQEFQTRRATIAELEDWWNKWPEANIGIVTGKISGVTVVDVEQGGDISKFTQHATKTATIKTGGGGYHFYYEYYPMGNKARIFDKTDIRGDGGYVVAPPSIHSSGNRYEVINKIKYAPFPAHLFGDTRPKIDWTNVLKGTSEGSRNQTAAQVAGKLLQKFQPIDWENTVWPLLQGWNLKNNPPLNEYELRQTYISISRLEMTKRGKDPDVPITFTDVLHIGMNELDRTNPETIVSYGYEWLDDKLTGLFPGELVVIGGETGTGKTVFATNIMYKASKKHKCYMFALEDRLADYGIKAVYFELGRVRKKYLGTSVANYPWNIYRKNLIEDPKYPEYRAEAIKNLENSNLFFNRCDQMMDIEKLIEIIEKKVSEGVELFLIDHLHYFNLLKGDSTKADYIEQFMVKLKLLLDRVGARVILVAHYKKLNGQKPRLGSFKDSASIEQNANYAINLWRDRGQNSERYKTEFLISKSRNPNGEATITADFDPTTGDYKFNDYKYGTGNGAPEIIDEINL